MNKTKWPPLQAIVGTSTGGVVCVAFVQRPKQGHFFHLSDDHMEILFAILKGRIQQKIYFILFAKPSVHIYSQVKMLVNGKGSRQNIFIC